MDVIRHTAPTLIAALCLWGCRSVGPDYEGPPELLDGSTFAGGDDRAVSPSATDHWWQLLEIPELDDLIAGAWENNRDLLIASERLREARALRGAAAAALLPGASVRSSFTRTGISSIGLGDDLTASLPIPNTLELWSGGLDIGWELDVFGGAGRRLSASLAREEAVAAARAGTRLAIAAEIVETYFAIAALREQSGLLTQQIDTLEDETGDVRNRFDAGASVQLELDRAVARLETTRAGLPPLEAAVVAQYRRLSILLGEHPSATDARGLRPEFPEKIPSAPAGLPAELLSRRPDLIAAERALAAATEEIGVAVADFYPKFTIAGGPNATTGNSANLLDSSSYTWGLLPRVEWSIFTGGARPALEAADARAKSALLSYERSVLGAVSEVESAIAGLRAAGESLAIIHRAHEAAQSAHQQVRKAYEVGNVPYVAVLVEEERLREVEIAEARFRADLAQSWVRLHRALGGGWE